MSVDGPLKFKRGLKVSKSRKQIAMSLILPKNERITLRIVSYPELFWKNPGLHIFFEIYWPLTGPWTPKDLWITVAHQINVQIFSQNKFCFFQSLNSEKTNFLVKKRYFLTNTIIRQRFKNLLKSKATTWYSWKQDSCFDMMSKL